MSVGKNIWNAGNIYLGTSSSSLVPFLYQTRTLQCKISSKKRCKLIFNASRAHRSFCATPIKNANPTDISSYNDIPFEGIPSPNEHDRSYVRFYPSTRDNPDSATSVPNNTLTAAEEEVFERIFKDIARVAENEVSAPRKPNEDFDDAFDEVDFDVDTSISSIFEQAIMQQNLIDEKRAASVSRWQEMLKNNPVERALDSPLVREKKSKLFTMASLKDDKPGEIPFEKEYTDIDILLREHAAMVTHKFEQCVTDLEVWRVLETDVFSLIEKFKEHEKENKRRQARLRSGEPKSTPKQTAKKKGGHRKRGEDLTATHTFPASAPLLVLQQNYSYYCVLALRQLRREFPTSPYALHLLPMVKQLGPISFVLGASPALYNELLFIKWTQYHDLDGMADLLAEMRDQGIEADEVTLKVLECVSLDRWRTKQTDPALMAEPVTKAWWKLRGVWEAGAKLLHATMAVRQEVKERTVRSQMEQKTIEKDDHGADSTANEVIMPWEGME